MSAYIAVIPEAIRRRWNALAVPQLCEALARESAENERLQRADSDAEYWRDQALSMQQVIAEESDLEPALTQSGELVFAPGPGTPCENSTLALALTAHESL